MVSCLLQHAHRKVAWDINRNFLLQVIPNIELYGLMQRSTQKNGVKEFDLDCHRELWPSKIWAVLKRPKITALILRHKKNRSELHHALKGYLIIYITCWNYSYLWYLYNITTEKMSLHTTKSDVGIEEFLLRENYNKTSNSLKFIARACYSAVQPGQRRAVFWFEGNLCSRLTVTKISQVCPKIIRLFFIVKKCNIVTFANKSNILCWK